MAGFSYYNRAKNLHKTAKIISDKGGVFPNSYVGLIELPGVGKYTASAISSICFNEKTMWLMLMFIVSYLGFLE